MIDIENDVFLTASKAVRAVYPDIFFVGEYIRTPTSFPCGSLEEKDNRNDIGTQDSGSNENSDIVMYEVNVYSNKINGKKTECKKIVSIVDKAMIDMGFTRIMLQPIPNIDDATIYRMTARYSAGVDNNNKLYRR